MKLKRTNKLLALLLAVLMVMSLLPVTALPVLAEGDGYCLIIDLTDYLGTINGNIDKSDSSEITLQPGQINTIDFSAGMISTESTITLNDFQVDGEIAQFWEIKGIDDQFINIADGKISLFLDIGEIYPLIILDGNKIILGEFLDSSIFDMWGVKSITISPVFQSGTITATATTADASKGSGAAAATSNENEWRLTAMANAGYSFAYWLKDNAADIPENRITENPYTVTLDADATFTAYFRERYALTAESEDAEKGGAAAEYLGAADGKDSYRLTAMPTDYYLFDKWTCGDDEYTVNPLDVAVAESGKSYTAHFKPVELTVSDEAALRPADSVQNGFGGASSLYGKIVSAGCRSALVIPVSVPKDLANVTVSMRLTDGEGQELAQHSETRDIVKGSRNIVFTLDPTPEDVSNLTAEITLTTPAGSSTVTKTYTGLSVAESETNDAFRFVSSPSDGYNYKTIIQAGANLNGVYARTDETTKALSLYGYGPKGVIVWNAGGASVSRLTGLPTGDGKEVKALGPNGKDGLTAVVGDTTITLYTWNGESWTAVEGSARAADASQKGTKIALVMDGDDVWTDTKHWTGSGWEDHAYDFASFQRVSDTEAYGVDGGGKRWRYDGASWSAAAAAPAAPDTSSVATSSLGMGQDQNGDWYCFVESRFHFIDDSGFYGYKGSDVYKWNEEKWVYQIMTDFNDPDDDLTETKQRIRPDGVNAISALAPGVSVMYGNGGANGAIYISADNVSITFDPGEGTLDNAALAKLTAPILSEIDSAKIPGATRDGFAFSGWFYDEDCTAEFKSGDAVMPGEDITLHAKWDENADPLAYHRQKALDELDKQFRKYSEADYTAENWQALVSACEDGRKAINEATAGTPNIEDNITAALNAALAKMQAIEPKNTDEITVAVSVDADVLGLGYLLKPTLVTVDKNSAASILTESVLNERAKERYGMTGTGLYGTNSAESSSTLYPWVVNTSQGWYLAEVYFPEQQNYKLPDAIQEYVDSNHVTFNDDDKTGKYLGEFDYTVDAGWLYSVGDKTEGNAAFPGLGASGWGLSDGEVVRWQYTVVGRGIDVGNDYNGEPIINAAEKSALTWEVATLRSKYSDATLEANEKYADALAVLTDAKATQAEVDAALAALRGETFTEPVTGVSLDQTELSVTVGKTAELTATVEPDKATDKTVTWSSSDETVATVADGVVTGVKAGTATITVTTTDGGKTATCAVTVVDEAIPVSGVTLDKESAELTVGDTLTLTATVAPSGAADKSVTWSSSDESVATVADGVVTAVKAGTATITVTTTDGGKTASCAVTVKAAPVAVTGVTLDKTTAEVKAGETVTLTATVAPADATDKTVTWSSSNVTVATVENGVVTGVKAGRVTITAAAGGKTATCAVTVTAAEEQPTELTYPEALKAVQDYLKKESPNPGVGSKGGEWAVFALNRGGVAEEDWNNKYLAALQTYVAENDGVLHEKKYTEYSRVVIALTSMGVDATQFKAGEKTYDLVSPLLDKQNNGKTWAEWQGNNGTAFALLALDSHNYLDNEEGNATRAALIASLKANQMENGGWPISGESVDLDVTAAAIYALAPYLNAERASAVGVSVSDVQAMIDKALAFLSSRQNENGGFGSAEADGWIIIALSTLGRDADTDEQFVKNGKSVLDDLLSYFDETTGGFKHLADGSVDQMASEQAAYDLAAYDRFKKGQKALYDMTDVAFPDPETPTVEVTGITLDITEASVEAGKTITLTAMVAPSNATNKIVTWSSGDETVATVVNGTVTGVKAGTATITATAGGKSASCAVTVTKASGGSGSGGSGSGASTINVSFRLIGAEKAKQDVDLGKDSYLPSYVTWIPTTSYELDEGATVYDLWVTATADHGIRSVGADNNYVETVYAPDGYALSEFTNGPRSGWMYTINGSHPGFGLVEQELHDGDEVIWHYVNDYSYEVADWFGGDDRWPSLGDGTYYNGWLNAPDRTGSKGGGSAAGGGSSGIENAVAPTTHGKATLDPESAAKDETVTVRVQPDKGYELDAITAKDADGNAVALTKNADGTYSFVQPETGVTVTVTFKEKEKTGSVEIAEGEITAKPEVADGAAKAELTAENVAEALKDADKAEALTVKVETEDAKSVEAALPAEAVKTVADADKDLSVETENGAVKIDADTLKSAADKDLTVAVKANADGSTTFDVTAGGETVDAEFKVELPAEDGQVLVIVREDGTEELVKKSVVEDGKAYAEIPAGATVKVIDNDKEFVDVADNAWYAEAVEFASSHELFKGVGDDKFAPAAPMTRAMLATVLYRLEDAAATGTNPFADVADGTWYTDAVTWANEEGIVMGTGKGFDPNANITREQIATMLYRYAKYLGLDVSGSAALDQFSDGSETASWAKDAMQWAVSAGLFRGDDNGALNPKGDATRAEVATLLMRMVKLIVK